jgi:hypothetical protein
MVRKASKFLKATGPKMMTKLVEIKYERKCLLGTTLEEDMLKMKNCPTFASKTD